MSPHLYVFHCSPWVTLLLWESSNLLRLLYSIKPAPATEYNRNDCFPTTLISFPFVAIFLHGKRLSEITAINGKSDFISPRTHLWCGKKFFLSLFQQIQNPKYLKCFISHELTLDSELMLWCDTWEIGPTAIRSIKWFRLMIYHHSHFIGIYWNIHCRTK